MISKLRASLAFVLVFVTMQLFGTGSAVAWSGSLPMCSGYPTDWESQLEADPRFTSNTSWVAFRRDWSGLPFNGQNALVVVWNQPNDGSQSIGNQLYFTGNGVDDTQNSLYFPSSSTRYMVSQGNLTEATYAFPPNTSVSISDLNCVEDTHNIQYHQSWVGSAYPDAIADYPSTTLLTGTVDCGGVNPVGVNVYQNGNNGSAILSSISGGRADWSYYLSGAPYGVQVLCGSDVATSYGMVSPVNRDWICDLVNDPHYCVLS